MLPWKWPRETGYYILAVIASSLVIIIRGTGSLDAKSIRPRSSHVLDIPVGSPPYITQISLVTDAVL